MLRVCRSRARRRLIGEREAERLVEGLGRKSGMCDEAVLNVVARALRGLERAGFIVPDAAMAEYFASARLIADAELAGVPGESAEAAVRYFVLGSGWWSHGCWRCGELRSR